MKKIHYFLLKAINLIIISSVDMKKKILWGLFFSFVFLLNSVVIYFIFHLLNPNHILKDINDYQGDEKIVDVLKSVGADIEWNKEKCTLSVRAKSGLSTKNLPHGELFIDISSFPDAVCALSAIACFIDGKTVITNVEICRKKETDRIKAMKTELCKLGGSVEEGENCLIIHGKNRGFGLHGGNCDSYKDHRIAMSLACLGLGLSEGESLTVCDAECCNVSFPHFFEVMNKIGAGFVCK